MIVDACVEDYFVKNVLPLKDDLRDYSLSVTGPISSGKSVVLQILHNLFEKHGFVTETLKEYIDIEPEFGTMMLTRFIDRKISNTTFQNYIHDVYSRRIKELKSSQILLMEKLPDDSVLCFSNRSNYNGEDLTDLDLFSLFNKFKFMASKHNIPTYQKPNFIKISGTQIEDVMIAILNAVVSDVKSGRKSRIVGLTVTLEVARHRIALRGRDSEDKYTGEYLTSVIRFYNNLYERLSQGKGVDRFTTIGSLME